MHADIDLSFDFAAWCVSSLTKNHYVNHGFTILSAMLYYVCSVLCARFLAALDKSEEKINSKKKRADCAYIWM